VKKLGFLLAVAVLAACASSESTRPARADGTQVQGTVTQFVTTPLGDLNVIRTEIPQVLVAARKEPYALPADSSCAALAAEVQELSLVLGPDLDATPQGENDDSEDDGGVVVEAASGAIRGAAEGIMPFRGWVRKLSGAAGHTKEAAAAIHAGTVRRAFLMGLGQTGGCKLIAAPKI